MTIHQTPFLRILLPFCVGIAVGWYTLSYDIALGVAAIGACLLVYAGWKEHNGDIYNNRHIKGIAITVLFIATGIATYSSSLPDELQGVKAVSSYEIYKYKKRHADEHGPLEQKALDIREELIGIYSRYVKPENTPIISAITLGKKDDIDRSVKSAFSLSGGAHVLAVSGLHVGIIYMILLGAAGLLPYKRRRFVITHLIIIASLWFYAFLCGLPASVIRSALMFTLVSGGFILERSSYSLNAVFVSAFIMLLIKPLYLFDVGFQLSYSAVISILLFYPKLQALLTFKNKIMVWIWGMVCVSAAAQIGTLPLSVYYFHQIPVYSLLTNFLVVPAAFFLIYNGIALLSLSWWHTVATLLGRLADFLTSTLQDGVQMIVELPYSVISDINIEPWHVAYIFALIVIIWLYIETHLNKYLQGALLVIVCYQITELSI